MASRINGLREEIEETKEIKTPSRPKEAKKQARDESLSFEEHSVPVARRDMTSDFTKIKSNMSSKASNKVVTKDKFNEALNKSSPIARRIAREREAGNRERKTEMPKLSPLEAKAAARAEIKRQAAKQRKIELENSAEAAESKPTPNQPPSPQLTSHVSEKERCGAYEGSSHYDGTCSPHLAASEEAEATSDTAIRDGNDELRHSSEIKDEEAYKERKDERMRRQAKTAAMQRRAQRQREVKLLANGILANDEDWKRLESKASNVTLLDVPELPDSILSCDGAENRTDRYKILVKRWHPDKFTQKFRKRLQPEDSEEVLTRVKAIFQALSEFKYICDL